MSRFLKPDVVRINLTGGDWITIKKQLTAGEQRRVQARMVKKAVAGQPIEIDLEQAGVANLVEYLIDWSFVDEAGQPVSIRDKSAAFVTDMLNNLDTDSYAEIEKAITDHERTLAEEKNDPSHRERIVSDLRICRIMRWTYDEVLDLPADVYTILVDELIAEADKA